MTTQAIETYPIGWAVDNRDRPSFAAYLIDLPGIVAQGGSYKEAIEKLEVIAPAALKHLRQVGKSLPAPSSVPVVALSGAVSFQVSESGRKVPSGAISAPSVVFA